MSQEAAAPKTVRFPPQMWVELAGLCLMLSESLAAALWYQSLTRTPAHLAAVVAVLAVILLFSHYLARLALQSRRLANARRAVLGVWLFLAVAQSDRLLFFSGEVPGLLGAFGQLITGLLDSELRMAAFVHMLAVALLVWRGIQLARSPISMGYNLTSFQVAAGAFLIYGLVFNQFVDTGAFFAFGLYLLVALMGLSFARIAYLGDTRGGRLPVFGYPWLARIFLSAVAAVLLAVSIGWLISGKIAYYLALAVTAILGALAVAVAFLMTPVIAFLVEGLMRLLENTPLRTMLEVGQRRQGINQIIEEAQEGESLILNLSEAVRTLLPFVILIAVVVLIFISLGWRPWQRQALRVEEMVETGGPKGRRSGPDGQPRDRLRNWLRPGKIFAAARIRRIYSQLMDLSARLDKPRPPAATPLEFLPALQGLFPEQEESVGRITHAYLKIRYGELPETNQEVEDVVAAWRQVNGRGRQLLAEKRAGLKSRPKK